MTLVFFLLFSLLAIVIQIGTIPPYCSHHVPRLHPTENVIVSWLRSLPGSQFSNLLTDLESERNPSDGFDTEICDFQSQSELSPPGLRVWHSLLYIYSNRGAWKQAIAILNYLKSSSRVDSVVYHRVITSLCHSKDLSSFSIAMNYYKEMKLDEIIPHPLTLVPLLRCLSNWSREGVAYADSLTQLADLSCSTCIQLSKMTDEQFLEYYLSNHTLLDTEEGFNFEALDSSLRDRQYVIEEIFTQLMISLACDRGLTVFAHSLKDHLQSHEVKVSTEGVFALIQVLTLLLHHVISLGVLHGESLARWLKSLPRVVR